MQKQIVITASTWPFYPTDFDGFKFIELSLFTDTQNQSQKSGGNVLKVLVRHFNALNSYTTDKYR